MNTLYTFVSPALSSTVLCFLVGLFVLLAILLMMVAFSVMISPVVVSAVPIICHVIARSRRPGSHDSIETGVGRSAPPQFEHRDHQQDKGQPLRASTVPDYGQILEVLERIIRDRGEGRQGSLLQRKERFREALERLPPRVCYGSHDEMELCSSLVKECVICLEDFEVGDLCQAFPMCNHFFHSDCIGNWLWKNPTCPLCRTCLLEK